MSQEYPREPSPGGVYVSNYIPEQLIGEIMEMIEAIGLGEKQEEAFKSVIKKKIRQTLCYDSIHLDEGFSMLLFATHGLKQAQAVKDRVPFSHELSLDEVLEQIPVACGGGETQES